HEVGERPAELERHLGGHRVDVRDAAHAVGAEQAADAGGGRGGLVARRRRGTEGGSLGGPLRLTVRAHGRANLTRSGAVAQGRSRCTSTVPCDGDSDSTWTPAGRCSDSGRTNHDARPWPVRERSIVTGPTSFASSVRSRDHGPASEMRSVSGSGSVASRPRGSFAAAGIVTVYATRRSPRMTKRSAAAIARDRSLRRRSDGRTVVVLLPVLHAARGRRPPEAGEQGRRLVADEG